MKHLLPCSCGQSIAIDTSQAGQRVTCGACGKSQDAPTFRGIKALPLAEEKASGLEAGRRPEAPWSPLQGFLFAAGLLLLLVGVSGAGYCIHVVREINVPQPTAEDFELFDAQVDKLKIDELYEGFLQARKLGLGPAEPPLYVVAQRVEAAYTRYALISAGVAGLGLLLAAVSLVAGGLAQPAKRPPSR
jgi:hypothetical protein